MSEPTEWTSETLSVDFGSRGRREQDAYLLVIADRSSRRMDLPLQGVWVVGRGADADVRIESNAVSRRHAKILFAGGDVQVVDMDSRNGTLVNGERIAGSRALSSGDVVSVGDGTLILHIERHTIRRAPVEMGRLRQRLHEELERGTDYARPLALLVVRVAGAQDREAIATAALSVLRRSDVLGAEGNGHLWVVLPEIGGEGARGAAMELLHAIAPLCSDACGGLATYPADGSDAETLMSGARGAAAIARPGEIATASETAVVHVIGERKVVVADPAMARVYDLLRRLSASDVSVLLLGETGVGKENAAEAIHRWSARASKRLVALDCSALPEGLAESELFGCERGAHSEARAAKAGLFEQADGGTVFLDEIGELALGTQAKLLRALDSKQIRRVGATHERGVDFRVVAATNRDLEAEVSAGRFRKDLFYRLSPAIVQLPALRYRPREVPMLARHFLGEACARAGRAPLELADATLAKLGAHGFPGNVRELKNAMEYAAATAEGPAVEPWDLPDRMAGRAASGAGSQKTPVASPRRFRPIADDLRDLERSRMVEALAATGGVQARAAELISMPVRTFTLKLKQYGIVARDLKGAS